MEKKMAVMPIAVFLLVVVSFASTLPILGSNMQPVVEGNRSESLGQHKSEAGFDGFMEGWLVIRPTGPGITQWNRGSETGIPPDQNWECVDETSANEDDDFVWIIQDAKQDSYNLCDCTAFGNITNVRVTIRSRLANLTATADDQITIKVVIDGSSWYGLTHTLTTAYEYYHSDWAKNPKTNMNWTWSDIVTLEAGFKSKQVDLVPNIWRVTQLYVTVTYVFTQPTYEYFIIVAGNYEGNKLDKINYGCNQVFLILRELGYSGDKIYYMNQPEYSPQDVDGDGLNDIDNSSTSANLQWAIETWASSRVGPTEPLLLYLFDHGGSESFSIDSPDRVRSTDLQSWLNSLEAATNAPIHVIYAACRSGSFIDELSKTGRVISSSCRPEQSSYVSADGKWEAFSQPFWSQIRSGHSVGWSFNRAYSTVKDTMGCSQDPLLDDNGDGVGNIGPLPNGGDGCVAFCLHIGNCSWVYPWISYVIAKPFFTWPPPATITLWAKVENKIPLLNVSAWMKPPDWTPPPPDTVLADPGFECFEMTDMDHDGNWTVDIPAINFTNHATGPSDFKFIITAEEENGMTTIPLVTSVGFTETGLPPPDDVRPNIWIEYPIDGRTVHDTITINGTATDNVCLQRVELYVDGNLAGITDVPPTSNSFFELYFDTRTVSNGIKTILVKAFDTSDNSGTQILTVIVNNPPLPFGGVLVPVDKFGLLVPYFGLASTILVATVASAIYVKHAKRRKKKQ